MFGCTPSFSILKLKTMDHVDAESAERVSGIATPLPNGIAQTMAAIIATRKVNKPSFNLAVCKKAMPRRNMDIGNSMKKITEA